MIPFVDWVEQVGFTIRGSYDPISDKSESEGPLILLPHQVDILRHCLTPGLDGRLPYTTIILSMPKKSGKTCLAAAIGAWFANQAVPHTEIFCLANDFEHAMGRVFDDIMYDAKRNQRLDKLPTKSQLVYSNGTSITALAQEYKSAAGSRHAMTIWDELWGYTTDSSRRLWAEMTPIKIPGVPISLRVIVTYAGFEGESDLLWDLYENVVLRGDAISELAHLTKADGTPVCTSKGRIFALWDTEHRMPWQTEDYYDEQLATLTESEYLRLHENAWVTGSEKFIPIDWWDNISTLEMPLDMDIQNPRRRYPVIIGCDASTKHDSTAVVGVQYNYDKDLVQLAFHKIWTPTPDDPMDFEATLERFILDLWNQKFKIASIIYDPTQLHRSMTRLKGIIPNVEEFPQTVNNMTAASETLYNLIKNKKLEVYPDEALRAQIKHASAEEKGRGFRIVKAQKKTRHHIDAAVALAMACYQAFKTHGIDISKPLRLEVPFSDQSQWTEKTPAQIHEEQHLPPQLREGGLTEEEAEALWRQYVSPDKWTN